MFDFDRSLTIAQEIGVVRRAYYRNALLAFLTIEALHKGYYVEGFANVMIRNFPLNIEHGWIELENGTINDPTFASLGHKEIDFYPDIKFTYVQAKQLNSQLETLPLAMQYGFLRHTSLPGKYRPSTRMSIGSPALSPNFFESI